MAVFCTKDGDVVATDPDYARFDEEGRLVVDVDEMNGRELGALFNAVSRSIEESDSCTIRGDSTVSLESGK